jgi:hypothetical protein
MRTLGLAAAVALGVALYGASLTAAAGNRIEAQIRRTVSCTTALRALQISAFASNPSTGTASVTISTGDPNASTDLLGLSAQQGYGLSGLCHRVTKRVALTHRGLTSAGVVHAGDIRWPVAFCSASRRVLLRLVIGLNASGKPVNATIAIRTQPTGRGKKTKPIGFVQWSPSRAVTYHAPGCTIQEQ